MKLKCPVCMMWLKKARLDVYWCPTCEKAWLIHKLSYKTLEEASRGVDKDAMAKTFLKPLMDTDVIAVPPK